MNPFPIDKLKEQLAKVQSNYRFSDDMIFASQMKMLFSEYENRRTGRSFLIIRMLIELSIEENRDVTLIDHYAGLGHQPNYHAIDQVLQWYYYQDVEINYKVSKFGKDRFVFTLADNSSIEKYNKIKIPRFQPIVEEKRQFSKLLLIL